MNYQWFYAKNSQQSGPISTDELKDLISIGALDPKTDLVWREGMPQWVAAENVPDLTANQAPTPAPGAGTAAAAAPFPQAQSFAAPAESPYAAPGIQAPGGPGYGGASLEIPWVKPVNFTLMAILYVLGLVIMAVGFVALFGDLIGSLDKLENYEGSNPPDMEFSPAALGALMVGLVCTLIGSILSLIYLYRAWHIIRARTSAATPGKAVGFLFIPFFNLYWQFIAYWKWSQEWNRIVASDPEHSDAPRMTEGLFLAYPIAGLCGLVAGAIAVIPSTIIFLMAMKKMCDAVNYAAAKSRPGVS